MKYNITTIDEINLELVIDFLVEILPIKYNQQIFLWEYKKENRVISCVHDVNNNKVLGTQGMIPYMMKINNEIVLTAKSESSYIAQELKGKGFFKPLYFDAINLCEKKGIDLIWGFTSLGALWEKLGFETKKIIQEVTINYQSTYYHFKQAAKSLFVKLDFRALVNEIKLMFIPINQIFLQINNNITLQHSTPTIEEIVQLEKIRSSGLSNASLIFDENLLKNRVDQNPYLKYHFISCYDKAKKLQAFSIIGKKQHTNSLSISAFISINEVASKKMILHILTKYNRHEIKFMGNKHHVHFKKIRSIFLKFGSSIADSDIFAVQKILIPQKKLKIVDWDINGLWTQGVNQ